MLGVWQTSSPHPLTLTSIPLPLPPPLAFHVERQHERQDMPIKDAYWGRLWRLWHRRRSTAFRSWHRSTGSFCRLSHSHTGKSRLYRLWNRRVARRQFADVIRYTANKTYSKQNIKRTKSISQVKHFLSRNDTNSLAFLLQRWSKSTDNILQTLSWHERAKLRPTKQTLNNK